MKIKSRKRITSRSMSEIMINLHQSSVVESAAYMARPPFGYLTQRPRRGAKAAKGGCDCDDGAYLRSSVHYRKLVVVTKCPLGGFRVQKSDLQLLEVEALLG